MIKKEFFAIGAFAASCVLLFAETRQPNILFFLVDDLGWRDLSCQGSDFYETPHIDALASRGVRFTQAYAPHPKCIASRMSIMSGKFPARLGAPGRSGVLKEEEFTLAEAFRAEGYATFFAGKWHIGKEDRLRPQDQGFDINIAGGHIGMPVTYFYPYRVDESDERAKYNVEGLEGGEEGEYLTDRLTEETIRFIRANKERPFFAYLSHYAVHEPIEAKPELVDKYRDKLDAMSPDEKKAAFVQDGPFYFDATQDNPKYAAMIQSIDESLGGLIKTLEEEGIADNTIIVVTSDNGGKSNNIWRKDELNQPTSNLPLRAAKSYMHEGGIRVPLIVKGPETLGGFVSEVPVSGVDHYRSLLEMCCLPTREAQHLDSVSYVPYLKGQSDLREEPLFWNFPKGPALKQKGERSVRAIRLGNYKLIEWWQDDAWALYDLETDIRESHDLSEEMPEKVATLRERLHTWVDAVGAPVDWYGK